MKLKVFNPSNQTLIEEIAIHNDTKDIDQALNLATQVHLQKPRGLALFERSEILNQFLHLMKDHQIELIELSTLEGGKPIKDTRVEFARVLQGIQLAIESIPQLKGQEIPMGLTQSSMSRIALTQLEPIGVVVSISAFNHPMNLIVHQVITAVAAGCPVIIKPALTTPLSCIKMMDLLHQAGLPLAWAQCLIITNENAEKLATDARVHFLSFIGSSQVGWHLRSQVAPGTRVALEHGGMAPVILEPDADLDLALPAIVKGAFYHAGQVCVSVQRLFVHQDILEKTISRLTRLTQDLIVGPAINELPPVGPLIEAHIADRLVRQVNESLEDPHTKIICGGSSTNPGYFQPTIILHPSPQAQVSQTEVFGPILCVYSYENILDAIEQANQTPMHFQSAVFTNQLKTAHLAIEKLNAKTVLINDQTAFRVDWMPFGGNDHSGLGTGGILQTMKEMSKEKLIIFHNPST